MDKIIKSWTVSAGTRVYYIDCRVDGKGQRYLSLTEIPKSKSPGEKKRHRIFLHAEILSNFMTQLQEAAELTLKTDDETDNV